MMAITLPLLYNMIFVKLVLTGYMRLALIKALKLCTRIMQSFIFVVSVSQ